ncbi:MAG TPA: hypothetical protein VEC99_06120 [Clostridia bacterium]|nr:hypothetical protein [Clostridia bacterium]
MKNTIRLGLSLIFGFLTAGIVLHYLELDYNLFRDRFDLVKATAKWGTQVFCVCFWFWIVSILTSFSKKGS